MVAIGNQWFWTYEVTKVLKSLIESYLVKSEDLHLGQARLLETTLDLVLPWNKWMKI